MGDRVRSPCRQISCIDQYRERADLCSLFCILEEVWLHTPTKKGFQRVSLWHTTLLAKCSVLYALSALLRKCGCHRKGQGHLKRQENRAVIAWRGAASAGLVSSADRAYMKTLVSRPTLDLQTHFHKNYDLFSVQNGFHRLLWRLLGIIQPKTNFRGCLHKCIV